MSRALFLLLVLTLGGCGSPMRAETRSPVDMSAERAQDEAMMRKRECFRQASRCGAGEN